MNIQEFAKAAEKLPEDWSVVYEEDVAYIQAPEHSPISEEFRFAFLDAGGDHSEDLNAVRLPLAVLPDLEPEQELRLYTVLRNK